MSDPPRADRLSHYNARPTLRSRQERQWAPSYHDRRHPHDRRPSVGVGAEAPPVAVRPVPPPLRRRDAVRRRHRRRRSHAARRARGPRPRRHRRCTAARSAPPPASADRSRRHVPVVEAPQRDRCRSPRTEADPRVRPAPDHRLRPQRRRQVELHQDLEERVPGPHQRHDHPRRVLEPGAKGRRRRSGLRPHQSRRPRPHVPPATRRAPVCRSAHHRRVRRRLCGQLRQHAEERGSRARSEQHPDPRAVRGGTQSGQGMGQNSRRPPKRRRAPGSTATVSPLC